MVKAASPEAAAHAEAIRGPAAIRWAAGAVRRRTSPASSAFDVFLPNPTRPTVKSDPERASDKRFAVGKTRPFADTRWWRRLRVREALRHEGLNLHQQADTVPRYCLN